MLGVSRSLIYLLATRRLSLNLLKWQRRVESRINAQYAMVGVLFLAGSIRQQAIRGLQAQHPNHADNAAVTGLYGVKDMVIEYTWSEAELLRKKCYKCKYLKLDEGDEWMGKCICDHSKVKVRERSITDKACKCKCW